MAKIAARLLALALGAFVGWYVDDFVDWVKRKRRVKSAPLKDEREERTDEGDRFPQERNRKA